jgi:hypothetical protein
MPLKRKLVGKERSCFGLCSCSGSGCLRMVGAAIAATIVGMIVHSLGAIAEMGYYLNPAYFPVWSKVMMPGPGPPGTKFYALSFLFGFIGWLLAAAIYSRVKGCLPGTTAKKGLKYGAIIFLLATLPGSLSMFLLFNLPKGLIGAWTIEGLIVDLLAGIIIAKLVK